MTFVLSDVENVCAVIRSRQEIRPDFKQRAKSIGQTYKGARGTMIVDVIASRQRRYEAYVKPKIILPYAQQRDGTLKDLAENPPTFLRLREYEVPAMSQVASLILEYGNSRGLSNEEDICASWASLPSIHDEDGPHIPILQVLEVKGIGPALIEYLRMLCGADTIKIDVRVIKSLKEAGVPVHFIKNAGIYEICRTIAKELDISLVELDSLLWLDS